MKNSKFDFDRIFREPDHFLLAPKHLRESKDFIKQCADENGGDFFIYVNDELKQDEDFVFENSSLHSSPLYLKEYKGYTFCKCLWGRVNYFSILRKYRNFDKDIALAIAYEGQLLEHYSPEFAFNNVSAFFYNSYDSFNYDEMSPKRQNNIYLAMASITKSFNRYKTNNKKIKNSDLFSKMSVIYDSKNFLNIKRKFKLDSKFIQQVLARNPDIYPYLDEKFKKKEKYLFLALHAKTPEIVDFNHSKYGIWILRSDTSGDLILSAPAKFHHSKNLYLAAKLGLSTLNGYTGKMNTEIARTLVELNPRNFLALSDIYKSDDLVIRTVLRRYPEIIADIDPHHPYYKKYATIAVKIDGHVLINIPEELWSDELISSALKNCGYTYRMLKSELKNNKKWIQIALKQAGEMYAEIPALYKSDLQIIWLALKNKPTIYEYLPTEFKNDLQICEYVYTKVPRMMEFMPKKCLINKLRIEDALKKDGLAWEFLPYKLKQDHGLMMVAESQNPLVIAKIINEHDSKFPLEYIKIKNQSYDLYSQLPDAFRNDPELALDAIKLNINNIYFLPVALMKNDDFMEKVYKVFRRECKRQWKLFKYNCDQLIAE